MSRYYKVEVDIYPIYTGMDITSREIVDSWGMEIDGSHKLVEGDQEAICYYGHMSMSGGHVPEEAHEELLTMLKAHSDFVDEDVRLASRWLDLDRLDWDEELGSIEAEEK